MKKKKGKFPILGLLNFLICIIVVFGFVSFYLAFLDANIHYIKELSWPFEVGVVLTPFVVMYKLTHIEWIK